MGAENSLETLPISATEMGEKSEGRVDFRMLYKSTAPIFSRICRSCQAIETSWKKTKSGGCCHGAHESTCKRRGLELVHM